MVALSARAREVWGGVRAEMLGMTTSRGLWAGSRTRCNHSLPAGSIVMPSTVTMVLPDFPSPRWVIEAATAIAVSGATASTEGSEDLRKEWRPRRALRGDGWMRGEERRGVEWRP